MDKEQMKEWIDKASYEQLLKKWRFEPPGSPWFQGEVGEHYAKVMSRKKQEIGVDAAVAASKEVGWTKEDDEDDET